MPLPALAVGGNTCLTATVIGGLPYTDTGNTSGFSNSYDEICPNPSVSSDVVYEYSPSIDECVDITLCTNTFFDTKLYVYASDSGGCPVPASGPSGNQIRCEDDNCSGIPNLVSEIIDLPMGAGRTYWIVVDGSFDSVGDYEINITAVPLRACVISCVVNGDCDDADTCTDDLCVAGVCQNPPNGTCCNTDADCDDGIFCNGVEPCIAGSCQLGTPVDCSGFSDACRIGVCDEVIDQCVGQAINEGAACDDGDGCTELDTCTAGTCTGSPIPDCLPCVDNSECADGLYCNGAEICVGGFCQPGTPVACDDGVSCTVDSCDETADACINTPLDSRCDDGQACNGVETCNAVLDCQAGTPIDCDDGDPCTIDTCDNAGGSCVHSPNPDCCDTDADCDDGNPCSNNICAFSLCETSYVIAGAPCGSNVSNACTSPDTCDGMGACDPNHALDGTACDDADVCTDPDSCGNGSCVGTDDGSCAVCAQGGQELGFTALFTDNAGDPLADPMIDIDFQFYDMSGTPIGSPISLIDVPMDGGVVATAIPITETVFDGSGRTLGISLNGTSELSPRMAVTSVPQALHVGCVADQVADHLTLGGTGAGGKLRVAGACSARANCEASVDITDGGMECIVGSALWAVRSTEFIAPAGPCDSMETILGDCNGVKVELLANEDPATFPLGTAKPGAMLRLYNGNADETVTLDAQDGEGARLGLGNGVTETIILDAGDGISGAAEVTLKNVGGDAVTIDADPGDKAARMELWYTGITPRKNGIILDARSSSFDSYLQLLDHTGDVTIGLYSNTSTEEGARLNIRDGRVITGVLEITGGCDLSEQFDITSPDADVVPGMVVSIDPARPGRLTISQEPYDRKVAGITSGAGGVKPGMLMGQTGSIADGQYPVALTGRVYCWVDASYGAIVPGDLLTTSSTLGHAMKVSDHSRAQGAILGKAMTSLTEGRGLVLVLVSLQ